MKLKIFALRDSKTDQYSNPMFLISNGHAVRSVADEVNRPDENNQLYKHPGDFEIFLLGEYDSDKGVFETHFPESVMLCSELVIKPKG